MIIENVTGYMLTNGNYFMTPGEKWSTYDTPVWVCMNKETAKQILNASQLNSELAPGQMWTRIYRVKSPKLLCTKIQNNLMYAENPTNIWVDELVMYKQPKLNVASDAQVLQNAKTIAPYVHKLINVYGGKTK